MAPSTALFPPGKGGGEEVARGGKGKGILIHTLTDAAGMPVANSPFANMLVRIVVAVLWGS